jgi:flagellar basal-body rod protein FlgF
LLVDFGFFMGGVSGMETPLIVALSRQMSVVDQMDVIANNIANMSTGAYKAERVMFKDYIARTESGDSVVFPQQSGIHRIYNPGSIERTSNPLDIALRGDGYMVVQTPNGPRYTRNGHLSLDAQGQLVSPQGYPVLDSGDKPIVIDTGVKDVTIAKDGSIEADDRKLGKLKMVTFGNPQGLVRQGNSLYKTEEAPKPSTEIEVLQGHVEGSNVEPVLEITRFMKVSGFYQSTKKIIDEEHDRQRRAIQQLGSTPE